MGVDGVKGGSCPLEGPAKLKPVKHPPPLHNTCSAFQVSVLHLKQLLQLNRACCRRHRLKRLHEGDCAFGQIVKLLKLLQRPLVSSLVADLLQHPHLRVESCLLQIAICHSVDQQLSPSCRLRASSAQSGASSLLHLKCIQQARSMPGLSRFGSKFVEHWLLFAWDRSLRREVRGQLTYFVEWHEAAAARPGRRAPRPRLVGHCAQAGTVNLNFGSVTRLVSLCHTLWQVPSRPGSASAQAWAARRAP